jgi:hypothetical protein
MTTFCGRNKFLEWSGLLTGECELAVKPAKLV